MSLVLNGVRCCTTGLPGRFGTTRTQGRRALASLGELGVRLPDCDSGKEEILTKETLAMTSLRKARAQGGISEYGLPPPESAKKPRTEGAVMLEMDVLRGLLGEQSQSRLKQHQAQLSSGINPYERVL